MLRKLIDTNSFIDRFLNPDLHRDIFLSEGLLYLSAVVFMELRAGAHNREVIKAVAHFTRGAGWSFLRLQTTNEREKS